MLLPALAKAKKQAMRIKCMSNQHQIGLAWHMYANEDSHGYFAVQDGWAAGGGQLPTNPYTAGGAGDYGGQVPQTKRPLNAYVPDVNTFHCPADAGDSYRPHTHRQGTCHLLGWMGERLPGRVGLGL